MGKKWTMEHVGESDIADTTVPLKRTNRWVVFFYLYDFPLFIHFIFLIHRTKTLLPLCLHTLMNNRV